MFVRGTRLLERKYTGYDRIEQRYFFRQKRSDGSVVFATTEYDVEGPTGQTGDGITLSLSSPTGNPGVGTGGVDWVAQYVEFDLVLTPPSSSVCRLDYSLKSSGSPVA